ncbi:MAG: DUF2207 domain-containing protein [Eubacteriales bacterium]|nr:DUF2207 domain-containing protein [Eubacteriales bacterium]
MKKLNKVLAILCVVLLFCSVTAFASNNVSQINIDVSIRDDGSAYIVQDWIGTFNEGTENYIPITTEGINVTDFTVSDEIGEYQFVDYWDIGASFDKKARKCGINQTSDGIELCFGISDYGEKRYSIEYVVEDFIKAYADYDGTNFMLVNPNMNTFPTDCNVTIALANGTQLTEENAGIWGFGYDGYIEFKNGDVTAYTTTALSGDNRVIVMLELDKGIIMPATNESNSFEEVKTRAMEGSDYGDNGPSLFWQIIGFIILFGILAIVIWIVVFMIKRKRAINKFYKEADYFRDVPNNGDLKMSHFLAQQFDVGKDENLIIGAVLLDMINKGEIEAVADEDVGMFGKVKQRISLHLIKEPTDYLRKSLYSILVGAAGEDGIVQEKELEKYTYKNPKRLKNFVDGAKKNGESSFTSLGGFSNGSGNCIKDLSEKGKAELAQIMGLKKYLDEFSLISEREVSESEIWQEYMVYAMLFGIADKVKEQFEKVYPEKIGEIETYNRNVIICHSYYHTMYRSYEKSIQAQRTSGGGGRTSIGGGGGFSGGGFGGGSR